MQTLISRRLISAIGGLLIYALAVKAQPQNYRVGYGTYLGGNLAEEIHDMAIDPQGNIYLAGSTRSANLPTNPPVVLRGNYDAVVAKLDPTGKKLLYLITIGGSAVDEAEAITVDAAGNAYIAGYTESNNFPTKSAYQEQSKGGREVFVTKIDPQGNIVFSTYLGGGQPQPCGCTPNEYAWDIAVNQQGNVHITGYTYSLDFPATVKHPAAGDHADAFLTILDPTGSQLVFSGILGGKEGYDSGKALAFDGAGRLYWAGNSASSSFPSSPDAYQSTLKSTTGLGDMFIVEVDPSRGEQWIVRSTFVGGGSEDVTTGLTFDAAGQLWLMGRSTSTNFPVTTNALQKTFGGGEDYGDAILARFTPQLDRLLYATYIGGSLEENGLGIKADAKGYIHVAGYSQSINLPQTQGAFHTFRGNYDGFYLRMAQDGGPAEFLSYFGGLSYDYGEALALDPAGRPWIAGRTRSNNFFGISTDALQLTPNGDYDAYVLRIDIPTGQQTVTVSAVGNAASYEAAKVAPGEIVVIFGQGIGPADVVMAGVDADGLLSKQAGGTSVTFDGVAAPMVYTSAKQVAAIVPYEIQNKQSTRLVVSYGGFQSQSVEVPVAIAAPGLFSADRTGRGQGSILNQDGSLNSASNPAATGSVITLYGTGEGQTLPNGVNGKAGSADVALLPKPAQGVTATIGGQTASVYYAGGTPYATAGLFQINLYVPAGLAPGDHEVIVRVGNQASQRGLTVRVR